MMQHCYTLSSLAILIVLVTSGCTQSEQPLQPGNKVMIDYTCRLADGSLVETTRAPIAGNEILTKSVIFSLRGDYSPFVFQTPEQQKMLPTYPFDPLEQKIAKAIVNRAGELRFDRSTILNLASEEGKDFAPRDRFMTMAKRFTLKRMSEVKMDEFNTRFRNTELTLGTTVDVGSAYQGVIRGVNDKYVTVYYSARPGATLPSILGPAPVRELDADNFEVNIHVQPGQLVQRVGGLPGRISTVDNDTFTIDFGQTFAGETLSCEVEVQPADSEQLSKHPAVKWMEDYQQGLSQARRQNKPVLLLIGNDCPDCKNMEKKLLLDPSLKDQRDRFILVKINGNQQEQLAKRFGQKDYPLILVLDGMGKEVARISGKQHIATLAYTLEQALIKGKKG